MKNGWSKPKKKKKICPLHIPPWTKQNNKITTTRIYQNKNGRWAFFMSWKTERKVDMLENLYVCKHVTDHMILKTNIFLLSMPYIAIWNVKYQWKYNIDLYERLIMKNLLLRNSTKIKKRNILPISYYIFTLMIDGQVTRYAHIGKHTSSFVFWFHIIMMSDTESNQKVLILFL